MNKEDYSEKLNFYRTLEVAALLHDIGKFKYRAVKEQKKKRHELYSIEFINGLNLPEGIDKEQVIKLVKNHHKSDIVIKGLNELRFSDQLSAEMDREEDEEENTLRPLETIFTSINYRNTQYDQVLENYTINKDYAYNPLSLNSSDLSEVIFPLDKSQVEKGFVELAHETWKEFEEKMKSIPANMSFNAWINVVNSLLYCYTSNITSSAFKTKPFISLYNHLVTTASISRCMIEYNTFVPIGGQKDGGVEEKRYLVINGDINGIQNFIFKSRFPAKARKDSTARLRGKSFFIELLSDAIVNQILKELNLDPINILSFAAGNFRILAPNTDDVKEKLTRIKQNIENYLFEQYGLDLGITIIWSEISKNEIRDFSLLEKKMGKKLEMAKYFKKKTLLFGNEETNIISDITLKFFEEKEETKNKKKCIICESPVGDQDDFCKNCIQHKKIGKKLPKVNSIIVSDDNISKNVLEKFYNLKILDFYYIFIDSSIHTVIKELKHSNYTVYFSDFVQLTKIENISSFGVRFFNFQLSMPKYNGYLISFDYLSEASLGIKRIGVLKADVDNLGLIFTSGLGANEDNNNQEDKEKKTISKLRDLSMRLELFFGYYTSVIANRPQYRLWFNVCDKHKDFFNEIEFKSDENSDGRPVFLYRYDSRKGSSEEIFSCKQCNSKNNFTSAIYGLFSGGDDFVFIGPWDMIIDFALEVNEEFKKYIANNPWLTISAGIVLSETNYPISRSLVNAERALDESKEFLKDAKNSIHLKNSVTLFDETLLWKREEQVYHTHQSMMELGDFKFLISCAKKIADDETKNKGVSRRFIHILLEMWNNTFKGMTKEDIQANRTRKFDYYPLLAYHIYRRYENNSKVRNEKFRYFSRILPWMKVPATWVIYRNRKRR
ncbi:MAG: type III-A CRISPR-associated protein Cas10/Csm1 [Candidatus Heimdallarchaeaceae archaeon]